MSELNDKMNEMLAKSEANAKNTEKNFVHPEDIEREVVAPDVQSLR